ncbi:MAG: HDOD domain-containing protein [Deltaproteobacteria bacterium]|nr:HDOD domain-containing protein [Deltaproteobacteria bacterium]
MTDATRIIQKIDSLPPFPQVAQKVVILLNDPEYSSNEVVRVIELDPSITAEILRMCNSAYFGLSRRVGSVKQAVSMLGKKKLIQLVMASSCLRYFKKDSEGYDLEGKELWRHSLACALTSQILQQRVDERPEHDAFTAGLLHDMGKLVLSEFVRAEIETILRLANDENYSFLEAEKKVLGMDHAELGARIAERWNFPDGICMAIRYHHTPQQAPPADSLTPVTYLANVICLLAGQGGSGVDGLRYRGYSEIMNRFGLRVRDLHSIFILLEEEMKKSEEMIKAA